VKNSNREVESYAAYVIEDSLEMACKSDRNLSENKLMTKSVVQQVSTGLS